MSREPSPVATLRAHAMRLRPGQDPLAELERWARDERVPAACIVTAVGSLTRACLRFANREQATVLEGHFEITSLVGTLSDAGAHLHATIADGEGRVYGGHLELGGSIYTTLELVVARLEGLSFDRVLDSTYGYYELRVGPARGDGSSSA
ncbi:PPC domain-containing DNA-binding protein [Paraliomyxa miuraensis]|uniref:PPC domain-containing DNA-binding protein n=1 Tax=Paraliomyxa miuraensis TaxID=376150 RepID=UPI00224F031D|nr:PPC domain-containing DNA-binding protein [Paraliomyxa miuraensis]MCX4243584.1 DNA-binding protein [Paraliomyxa miuraensis]